MLPLLRSGKISTRAFPRNGLSAALRAATAGTIAASTWSSPSMAMSSLPGNRRAIFNFAISTASTIFRVRGLAAERFVE